MAKIATAPEAPEKKHRETEYLRLLLINAVYSAQDEAKMLLQRVQIFDSLLYHRRNELGFDRSVPARSKTIAKLFVG